MTDMAHRYEKRIKDMSGQTGSSEQTYIFRDKSQLIFLLGPNPNPRAIGAPDSDAHQFAQDVASFRTFQIGYEFVFKDGSKLTFDLSKAPVTLS